MTCFKRPRSGFALALFSTLLLCQAATAQNPLAERWADAKHFEPAKMQGRRNGQMVAVVYAYKGTLIIIGNNEMLGHRAFNNSLRIGVWTTSIMTVTGNARIQGEGIALLYDEASGKDDGYLPRTFLVGGNGRLLGVVLSEDLQRVQPIVDRAGQMNGWYHSVEAGLLRVEQSLDRGRFKAAIAFCQKTLDEDARVSKMLSDELAITYDPSKHPGTADDAKYWADLQTAYQAELDKAREDEAKAKADGKTYRPKRIGPKPAFLPEVFDVTGDPDAAGATFFPKLLSIKKTQYNQMVVDKMDQARVLHGQGKPVQAIALIEPIVRDGADLPAVADAKALLDEWKPAIAPSPSPAAPKKP